MAFLQKLLCFMLLIGLTYCQSCPSDLNADVIIVGAGMAGISAAERLQENGINNILILEGSNRVGGRMKSARIGGAAFSLGPGWMIGRDPADPSLHPLWEIAERCDPANGIRGFYPDYDSLVNYNTTGDQPPYTEFRWDDYSNAMTAATNLSTQLDDCDGVSLRYGLNASGWTPITPIDNWVEWYNSDYPEGAPPESQNLCTTLGDLDQSYTNFTSPGSGNEGVALEYFISDPDGYEKLAKCVADEVLEEEQTRIMYETVVSTIDWNRDGCACVTASVNGVDEEYCAKYVITTMSPGVLQSGDINFVPELPQTKRDVINRFVMSIFIHIVMEFGEAFWDTAQQIGYIGATKGVYPIFLNHNVTFLENPNVLDVIVTGDEAKRISGQDKATTISEIEAILATIYPDANVTVIDSEIGDWYSDPLFRGSFIHYSRDLRVTDFALLAEPIGNLFISGSATSTGFGGYVHGAFFAGREAADRVLLERGNSAVNLQISIFVIGLGVLCALFY